MQKQLILLICFSILIGNPPRGLTLPVSQVSPISRLRQPSFLANSCITSLKMTESIFWPIRYMRNQSPTQDFPITISEIEINLVMIKVQFPMSHSKRKFIQVTVKIESQPRAPTKMGRYRWLIYYCNRFMFTVRHRELY